MSSTLPLVCYLSGNQEEKKFGERQIAKSCSPNVGQFYKNFLIPGRCICMCKELVQSDVMSLSRAGSKKNVNVCKFTPALLKSCKCHHNLIKFVLKLLSFNQNF